MGRDKETAGAAGGETLLAEVLWTALRGLAPADAVTGVVEAMLDRLEERA